MEPHDTSQRWPPGEAPAPAWTKTIKGAPYTIKRIGGTAFGIWREAEEIGTFELHREANELRATYAGGLTLEARAVVDEFIDSYSQPFEGAAKRDE